MNLNDLADDLGLDMGEFGELAAIFIETTVADLDRMREGTREGDCVIVARAAHSIKGAAGNLGFSSLHDTARGLEMKAKGNDLEGTAAMISDLADELARLSNSLRDATSVRT